jgi:aspartate kinase
MEDLAVSDVTLDSGQSRVALSEIPDEPGIAARIFSTIALGGVVVDMIVQNVGGDGRASLSFTVPRGDYERTLKLSQQVLEKLGAGTLSSEPDIAKLSLYGIGMRSHTGVATRMFEALAARQINVRMINMSENCVSTVVESGRGDDALAALEDAFKQELA